MWLHGIYSISQGETLTLYVNLDLPNWPQGNRDELQMQGLALAHCPVLKHLGNESRNKNICCFYRFPKFKILLLLCFEPAISEHPAPQWKAHTTSTSDPSFPNPHLQPNYKPLDTGIYEETAGTSLANTINATAAALTRTAEVEVIPILFAIQPHTVPMLVLSEM